MSEPSHEIDTNCLNGCNWWSTSDAEAQPLGELHSSSQPEHRLRGIGRSVVEVTAAVSYMACEKAAEIGRKLTHRPQ